MPIPTIPERDEELEKFINEEIFQKGKLKIESEDPTGTGNGTMYWVDATSVDDVLIALNAVAAFSARRAREKAIEECLKLLSDAGVNNYRYDSEGHDWKQLFEELEQLKSKPQ